MKRIGLAPASTSLAAALCALLFIMPAAARAGEEAEAAPPPPASYSALPSDTPARFEPATDGFDHVRRDLMIPVRDGVKLHTVILVPRGAKGAPILLTRTPYNATELTSHAPSAHLGPVLNGYDNATEVIVEGGYQLMVSADIFRGRYRGSLETPGPIVPDEPLPYRFALPTANHVFLPDHRIMVQVQSSWFPLYDRNPQTFVPSIFWARPGDYRKAVQRVFHAPGRASFIELPLVTTPSGEPSSRSKATSG